MFLMHLYFLHPSILCIDQQTAILHNSILNIHSPEQQDSDSDQHVPTQNASEAQLLGRGYVQCDVYIRHARCFNNS